MIHNLVSIVANLLHQFPYHHRLGNTSLRRLYARRVIRNRLSVALPGLRLIHYPRKAAGSTGSSLESNMRPGIGISVAHYTTVFPTTILRRPFGL
jgi:hypothetical protein